MVRRKSYTKGELLLDKMHQLSLEVPVNTIRNVLEAYKEAMEVKNCSWAKTLPELLDTAAEQLAGLASEELRRASALLRRADILSRGGAPIMVVCSMCKLVYSAKGGGEAYPENKRVSHGYCPPCNKIQRKKMGLPEEG